MGDIKVKFHSEEIYVGLVVLVVFVLVICDTTLLSCVLGGFSITRSIGTKIISDLSEQMYSLKWVNLNYQF
jgi:hypothetical protein